MSTNLNTSSFVWQDYDYPACNVAGSVGIGIGGKPARLTRELVACRPVLLADASTRKVLAQPKHLCHIAAVTIAADAKRIYEAVHRGGRNGGSKGGKARARNLSAKRRKQIATAAAQKRWSNRALAASFGSG